MSKRNLFDELSASLIEAKQFSEGQLSLSTHTINDASVHGISPNEIVDMRQSLKLSRGVFAQLLHVSSRTLANWERGQNMPNGQAVTLLKLVQRYPETLSQIAGL